VTKGKIALYLVLILVFLLPLLFAYGQVALAETPEPEATDPIEEVIVTRTPAPTATPGPVAREVDRLAARTGLARTFFLGLATADWINLGISLLFVLIGYLIGTWLIRRILPRVVRSTAIDFDEALLKAIGPDIRWLVVILVLHFATVRLAFLGAGLKKALLDVYFVVGLAIAAGIVWQLIDLAGKWYRDRVTQAGNEEQLGPIITLLARMGRVIVGVVGISILLSHFGINVIACSAALGITGLALSLAARDTLTDMIAGLTILVDRPFQVGDRIEIQEVGTWGDVVEIGARTTRIRTRDNRMVIVPNSTISKSQVVNYTFPDPRYRIQMDIGVGYGMDVEQVRRIIIDTVSRVEGVLTDKPVDALYVEMGDSAMIFRVRWWLESYVDTRQMFDKVNTALQGALDEAGIDMPYPTENLNLQVQPDTVGRLHQALQEPGPPAPLS
jgi:small-conductance mechanosensitive channel